MIKEIKYNGYTANPSDYECPDGDLATSFGLLPEDGAMKPVFPPSLVLQLETGAAVKFIHETTSFRHYIILKTDGTLQWLDGEAPGAPATLRVFTTEIYQATAVGNTLIVLASDGMHYFLWKGAGEGYLYLGTEIPECPLSFGLQGEMARTDEFEIYFDSISEGDIWNEFSDANKTKVTGQVLAKVNKFIAENSTGKGKFIYPFLLRYAYRLYDGSLTKHSAPILMIASSDLAPQVFWTHITGKGSYTNAKLRVVSVLHKVDFAAVSESHLANIRNWKDIVRSVDIFISKPIYTYDQNGECTGFKKVDDSDCYCVCKHINQAASADTYPLRYQFNKFSKLYAFTYSPGTFSYPRGRLMLPKRSVDDVKSDIKNCSQFYFLESIKIEQLSTTRALITVEDDYLQSLVAREVMTDDYDSHDKIIPKYSFPYNSRLNIANLKKVLFRGHDACSLFNFSDGYVDYYPTNPTLLDIKVGVRAWVFIKQDGKDIVVCGEFGLFGHNTPLLFFYYPNANAYKAVIERNNYLSSYYEIPLEKHDFLNGSFYFGGWDDLSKPAASIPSASSDAERTIEVANKIYTSEVNNPFHFPVLGINTVGTGNILGICAAAKALSEGQFGQFPLYAFTTEGVWALEVSSRGTYSAKQPITRDVVVNPGSITQIDSAVLFATDRGVMHISGSSVQCISDIIDTEAPFSIAGLPKADALVDVFNSKAGDGGQINLSEITLLPFGDFLRGCRMLYDYTNQRIIAYNANVRYAYVFSLKSKSWGMMRSDIADNVNSYPEALAMAAGSKLVDISKPAAESVTCLVITRPFKMDGPDLFKTINTVIQRGMFRAAHVQQVLYGSNDLMHWHAVWSSVDKVMRGFRGTPYKAYRLALVCDLNKDESIYGCSVVYEPRMTNQVR